MSTPTIAASPKDYLNRINSHITAAERYNDLVNDIVLSANSSMTPVVRNELRTNMGYARLNLKDFKKYQESNSFILVRLTNAEKNTLAGYLASIEHYKEYLVLNEDEFSIITRDHGGEAEE